jgi:hypothetical protein
MMSDREKSCAERVRGERDSFVEWMRDLIERIDSDDDEVRDEAYEELMEAPLSVEVEHRVKVVFSTGGPHTEVEIDPGRGTYTFRLMDWWDGATAPLTDEEAKRAIDMLLLDDVEYFIESYHEGRR